jgi:hypothetical protein
MSWLRCNKEHAAAEGWKINHIHEDSASELRAKFRFTPGCLLCGAAAVAMLIDYEALTALPEGNQLAIEGIFRAQIPVCRDSRNFEPLSGSANTRSAPRVVSKARPSHVLRWEILFWIAEGVPRARWPNDNGSSKKEVAGGRIARFATSLTDLKAGSLKTAMLAKSAGSSGSKRWRFASSR